jgi:tetratricopeptide (TPR) repeat protein
MDALFYRGMALLALDEKAGLLEDAGRTDAAIAELGKVYDFDIPKDHPAYEVKVRLLGKLATLYVSNGRKDEAVETIEGMLADVAKGTPAEAAAWFEAGKTYRAAGMTENALEAFDRAIALSDALAKAAPERGPRPGGDRPGRGHGGSPGHNPPPPPPGGEPQ